MSRRFGSDDETEAARRRHAADEARAWEEDRRATDRMWREGEMRRDRERWDRLREQGALSPDAWHFVPLHSESGTVVGWEAFLNSARVGMLIQTPHRGIAVIAVGDDRDARVHYMNTGRAPDTEEIVEAHQRWLEAGR